MLRGNIFALFLNVEEQLQVSHYKEWVSCGFLWTFSIKLKILPFSLSLWQDIYHIVNGYEIFKCFLWAYWCVPFLLQSIEMPNCINWFSDVEPDLHTWAKPHLIDCAVLLCTSWFNSLIFVQHLCTYAWAILVRSFNFRPFWAPATKQKLHWATAFSWFRDGTFSLWNEEQEISSRRVLS